MGYWWSSSSSSSSPPPQAQESQTYQETVAVATTQSTSPALSHTRPEPLSPDQQADKEFESFFATLEANAPSDTPHYTRSTKPNDSTTTPLQQEIFDSAQHVPSGSINASTSHVDLDTLDITPKALYPRTMSCRQAFDQAFYCQSLGGKFNDLYRYGGIRSCSPQWSQFWFCMRVRTLSDKEREHQTAEWYESREDRIKKERAGSSEDVWELRTEPVKKAFWKDPDELTQS